MRLYKVFEGNILKLVKFTRALFSKKTLIEIARQFNNPAQSDELKAFSAAFGIFMGIIPIWGVQTLAAIFLAVLFRLNKVLVVLFSQVSFPPFMPLIVFLSYRAGQYWVGNSPAEVSSTTKTAFQNVNRHIEQYIYGSISLAFVAAIITGLLTFMSLKLIKTIRQHKLTANLKRAI